MINIKEAVSKNLSEFLGTNIIINDENFFLVNGVRSRLTWNPALEKDLQSTEFFLEFIGLYRELLTLERKYFLEKNL